jgi:uncharacterized protein YjdB
VQLFGNVMAAGTAEIIAITSDGAAAISKITVS